MYSRMYRGGSQNSQGSPCLQTKQEVMKGKWVFDTARMLAQPFQFGAVGTPAVGE